MQRVDGSGDHDARRAQKQRIVLDRLNERAAYAALLLLRQHKDGIEAALSRVFVVRPKGGAADHGPVILAGDVEVHLFAASQEVRAILLGDHFLDEGRVIDSAGGDAGGKLRHADDRVCIGGGKTADIHITIPPCVYVYSA